MLHEVEVHIRHTLMEFTYAPTLMDVTGAHEQLVDELWHVLSE
jgi:hypothetical protein